ncbi:hypothetical protein [Azospirillum sp. SYSU D00513]|uniref:hypothetical protein n=1 Tax=Azospirillum sp. SYSU D00513 TaxID=2812561 RepID=UPI001A96C832|nr:hypothetical protein [Azospirillum sp. SYSU D00513]
MPKAVFTAALLGLTLAMPLAGCGASGAFSSQGEGQTLTVARPDSEAACREAGGRWAKGGRRGLELCFMPLSDGGKACTARGDCAGECLVTEAGAQCQKSGPIFGCYSYLDDQGRKGTICRD